MATKVPYPGGIERIRDITQTSATFVRTDFVGGPDYRPTRWSVQYQNKGSDSAAAWDGAPIAVQFDDTQKTLNVGGLQYASNYLVRTRYTNSAGTSDWSPSASFRTLANPPSRTRPYYIDAQGAGGLHYLFSPPADNGGSLQGILEMQVGWGTDPNAVQNIFTQNNGDAYIWNLNRSTTYYVWSRARNEIGWSAWSERYQVTTDHFVPAPPTPIFLGDVTQNSAHYMFRGEDDGGAYVQEWQIGYSTDPNNVQHTTGSWGDTVIGGLTPATVWYFWARGRNDKGWSAWSSRSQIRTTAGARVKVDGSWREAVPFVKVNGTWRLAQPYVKSVGLWKKSV